MTDHSASKSASKSVPNWQQAGQNSVWMPYSQMKTSPLPSPVVQTEGVHLILDDGRKLIDGLASWWTACHGYNHPHIAAEVVRQLKIMPHVMFGGIQHPQAVRLAVRLADLLPGSLNHVFFSDSGSVSVEVAMKMAVQYWLNLKKSGRHKFVCFENAYHGDTTGAMSVCDPINSMHAHFHGFLPQQFSQPLPKTRAQFAEFDAFLKSHSAEIAAVILEPLVQGAGGMKFHSPEVLAQIAQACRRHGLLLILDEIATGFGRTGSMFACEQANVVPDIICLGKALTAGTMTLAATVATDQVFDAFWSDDPLHALMHGPTFMANPLACAAANASLDLFEREPRLQQAQTIERQMIEMLAAARHLPGVVDVRCKGAVGVIQTAALPRFDQLRQAFIENGVWLRPFNNMIYLTPPLVISEPELFQLCDATLRVTRDWAKRNF